MACPVSQSTKSAYTSDRTMCIEMRDGARAFQCVDLQAGISQPPLGIGESACWTEGSRSSQHRHVGICAEKLTSDGELTNQPATRSQTPRDLSHGAGRVGHAVQTVETDAQIKIAAAERHPLDAALDDLAPMAMFGGNPALSALQHRR